MPETPEEATQRYTAAAHAMQTGVATKMGYDRHETDPKHLRVGINSAHVTNAALAKLLIDKGILTAAEYSTAVADAMEAERDLYQREVNDHYGPNGPRITLA